MSNDTPVSTIPEVAKEQAKGMTMRQLLSRHGCPTKGTRGQTFWDAISTAENSSRDPKAVSPPNADGSVDVGLFQVNLKAHPQYSKEEMQDADKNVAAAKSISNNWTNPNPWTTYKNGAWRNQVNRLDEPIKDTAPQKADLPTDPITGALNSAASTAKDGWDILISPVKLLIEFAKILFDPNTWFRVGKVIIGGILILIVGFMAIRIAD